MCLPLFEYVAAKKNAGKLNQAVMLLSEFSGSNKAFKGYLEYNPFNVQEFLQKLDYCLSMSPEDKEELMKQAVAYLEKASTSKWVESFLKDLKIAHKPRSISYYLGPDSQFDLATNAILRSDMRMLNFQSACDQDFSKSNKCVIFIDHEALPVLEYSKESMTPTASVLDNIREIVSDPLNRNIVIIFSNQSVGVIEEQFGRLLKSDGESTSGGLENLWVAAESGYLYRTGSLSGENSEWRKLRNLST